MYDYIKGTLTYTEIDSVVIETGGIGYRIFCANPHMIQSEEKRQTQIFVHHHVREDVQMLFGFHSREERRMFRLLLEVSGIGPKGASAMVAHASPSQIALAIAQEDVKFLTKFPGIGQKTAKRVILDLKDKLKADGFSPTTQHLSLELSHKRVEAGDSRSMLEALEALLVLGFQESEVLPILKASAEKSSQLSAEALIKEALKELQRF